MLLYQDIAHHKNSLHIEFLDLFCWYSSLGSRMHWHLVALVSDDKRTFFLNTPYIYVCLQPVVIRPLPLFYTRSLSQLSLTLLSEITLCLVGTGFDSLNLSWVVVVCGALCEWEEMMRALAKCVLGWCCGAICHLGIKASTSRLSCPYPPFHSPLHAEMTLIYPAKLILSIE